MGKIPDISACIITYNREQFLYAALESLANQSLDKDAYEVILVDNNSTDNTPQIAENFQQNYPNVHFKYFLEEIQGESAARNRVLRESTAPLIAFIDDDAIASEDYLTNLINFFKERPDVMAAGGKILPYFYPSGQKELPWLSHYLLGLISCVDQGSKIKPFPKSKYPLGCNMAFRRAVFDQLGNFDNRLGRNKRNLIGNSEKDMFLRMRDNKMPIYYLPNAWVYHTMPEERIAEPFIRELSVGIGQSEKLMYKNSDLMGRLNIILKQAVKTAGTGIIALGYYLKGEAPKGRMLFWYRVWFFNGFFQHQADSA